MNYTMELTGEEQDLVVGELAKELDYLVYDCGCVGECMAEIIAFTLLLGKIGCGDLARAYRADAEAACRAEEERRWRFQRA